MSATPGLSLVEGFKGDVDFNFYLRLYDELHNASLDVIQHTSADPNLFSFTAHCTFFATIVKSEGAALNLTSEETTALGLIFCTPSTFAKELNIGLILHHDFRGQGYARRAVQIMLRWAFETAEYHRVHAAIIDNVDKDRSISLFTQLGFGHEGIRRRSVFSPAEGIWKDVIHFAMLDTDWIMCPFLKRAPKSLWDELFARHERERQELLRWEENKAKLNRTASMETVRVAEAIPGDSGASGNDTGDERNPSSAPVSQTNPGSVRAPLAEVYSSWRSPSPNSESDADSAAMTSSSPEPHSASGSDWEVWSDASLDSDWASVAEDEE